MSKQHVAYSYRHMTNLNLIIFTLFFADHDVSVYVSTYMYYSWNLHITLTCICSS